MNNDTDIIIVGGGLIGSALAIALSSIGFDVTVVDRQSNKLTKSKILMEEHTLYPMHLFVC